MLLMLRSVGLAVVVSLAGWGALTFLWYSTPQDPHLRGFYDYPSAVWGDGLLLPVLAAALTYAIGQLPRPRQHFPAALAAVIGSIAGGLVIFGWWSDPNPGLNWTMPAAHQLNDAGKWHAVFLVGASALFATLWVEFLHRLRTAFNATSTRPLGISLLRSGPFALVIGTTLAYTLLAGLDSARVGTTSAGAASLIALTGSALFLVVALTWATRGNIGVTSASAVSGVILAGTFTVLALTPPLTVVAGLLTVMAVAAGFSLAMTAEPPVSGEEYSEASMSTRGSPALEWLVVPALFGIVPLIAQHAEIGSWRLITSAAVVVIVVALSLGFRWFRRREWDLQRDSGWFVVAAFFLVASYGVLVLLQAPDLGFYLRPLLLTLTAAVLSQIALTRCQTDYARLMELEQSESRKSNRGLASPNELAEQKGIWGRIGGSAIAATVAIISLTVSIAPAVGWLPATGQVSLSAPSIIFGGAAVAILAFAIPQVADAMQQKSPRTELSPPRLRAASLPAAYAGCGLFVIAGVLSWVDAPSFHPVAALQSALIAVFIVECVLGNGLRLNLVGLSRETAVLGLLAGAATFVTVYWALTKGVGSSGVPVQLHSSLLANAGAMLVVTLIAITATASAYACGRETYLTQYTPVSNAMQDSFLISLLWLVLAWMPQIAAEHISRDDPLHIVKVLGIVLSIIILCGKTLLWITENNDSHSGRERSNAGFEAPDYALPGAKFWTRTSILPKRICAYLRATPTESSKDAARYEALDGHIAVQNAAALALVGVTLVGAVPAVVQLLQEHAQTKPGKIV